MLAKTAMKLMNHLHLFHPNGLTGSGASHMPRHTRVLPAEFWERSQKGLAEL